MWTVSESTLTIAEGGSAVYTVVLDTQPTADVTVTISGHAGTDITLSDTTLTFTVANWETPQTVTVSAAQDDDATTEQAVTLSHTVSGTDEYAAVTADSVVVTVIEDDTAGVSIDQISLMVAEGGSNTYTVVLDTQPTADVTVTISGHDGSDVSVDKTTLTFTAGNWSTPQTVTVSAAQDEDAVADAAVVLTHAVAGTGEYASVTTENVTVTITEDDSAGVSIDPTELIVTEGDATGASYTVALDSQPTAEVTVTISGHADTDITLSNDSLTFTVANWDVAQTVTVTVGEDDDASADAAVTLSHAVSGSGEYASATADSVTVTITEDDSAGVSIAPTTLTVPEEGSGAYTVVLTTRPSADVTVTISGHTATDITLSNDSLTFTAANWNVAQTVTVSAASDDDAVVDDTVTLSHAVSSVDDTEYNGITADSVTVTTTEDDTAGVSINPTALTVPEDGSGSYTVVLTTQPRADVTIDISGHADTDVTLSSTTLTFTAANWDVAQTVTVTVAEDPDAAADEAVTLSHAVSGTDEYQNVTAADVEVTITDDDTAGVSIDPTALTVPEGSSDTYTVVLTTRPTADVTVTISGHAGTDVSVDKTSLTFTAADWDAAQTVTVSAAQDDDATTDDAVTLSHAAGSVDDEDYNGISTDTVTVTITEDDTVGVTVSADTLTVLEGGNANYTVVLDSQPTGDVTVAISGHDGTDITLSTDSLTFTTANWTTPQTVTVRAAQDEDAAADAAVTLSHVISSVDDSFYNGISIQNATVTITEDDSAGVSIDPTDLTVVEGSSGGYTVVLDTQPTGDVTVTISGHAGTDITLDETTLTFTADNWDAPQKVTVSAAQDDDAAADAAVSLSHTVISVDDTLYNGISTESVPVTITDDDTAGVSINPTALTVPEGSSSSYTVVLDSQPTGDVTVTISGHSGTDVSVDLSTLTFTAADWDAAQTVNVSADQDDDATTDDAVTLSHAVSSVDDEDYNTTTAESVTITIDEADTAGVSINPTALTVLEGGNANYTVVLDSQPIAEVTVTISGHAGTDITLDETKLTFTAANWDVAQTVTVSAAADDDAAADDAVTLSHAVSGTDEYLNVAAASVVVTVTEANIAGVSINPTALTVIEGDTTGASYTVVLDSQPTGDVTVTVNGHAGTDITFSATTLTFTAANWDVAQTVTVTAAADDDAATNDSVTLSHTVSGTGEYASVTAESVTVTITEDDTAGVSINPTALIVIEGDATGSSYTVVLTTRPGADVTVTISGHAGTDITLSNDSLTFTAANWNSPQTVTVSAAQDHDATTDPAVTLSHTVSGTNEYASVTADSVVVTITEDDTAGVSINPTALTVIEGDATGSIYTVVLTTRPGADVTVTISGADGTDINLSNDSLIFTAANWNSPQTVTVRAAQDEDASADDAVTLSHAVSGTGEYASVTAVSVTVTITEDDTAGVSINPTALTVSENSSGAYTVVLDTQPSADVTVTISGHDGTDIALSNDSLTFTPSSWNIAQTVTLTAGDVDSPTGVTLSHEVTGSGEYGTVTADDVVVTVLAISEENQDPAPVPVTVSFASETLGPVREGIGNVNVELNLSVALDSAVDIPIIVSSQSTAGNEDYSGVPATVTFAPDQSSASFQVEPLVDLEDEDEEQVVLVFGTLPEGISAGGVTQTTVTILDAVRVSFDASSYEATEGGPDAMVAVQLNEPAPYEMTVPLTAEGRNGADESDWSGVPDNVVFNTGDSLKSFTVIAVDDTVEDDDEMVKLGFGALPGGLIAEDPATATLTIMNQENGQPTGESCSGAVWGAVVTFAHQHGSDYHFIYHPANTDSSMSNDHFTYNGTKYTVKKARIVVYPEELYYGPPYHVPGFSYLTLGIGAGSHDWETASYWGVLIRSGSWLDTVLRRSEAAVQGRGAV